MTIGATLVSGGSRIDNDILKNVAVKGAYNLPTIEETFEVITDTCYPGWGGEPPTGADGENTRRLCDDKSARGDGVFELDLDQIANCDVGYVATDEAKYIRFGLNPGAFLRNIKCVDPVGVDVEPLSVMTTASGTQGQFMIAKEPILASSATGTTESFAATTIVGANAAVGTHILTFMRCRLFQLYFLTDPSAAYRDVMQILH